MNVLNVSYLKVGSLSTLTGMLLHCQRAQANAPYLQHKPLGNNKLLSTKLCLPVSVFLLSKKCLTKHPSTDLTENVTRIWKLNPNIKPQYEIILTLKTNPNINVPIIHIWSCISYLKWKCDLPINEFDFEFTYQLFMEYKVNQHFLWLLSDFLRMSY